MIVAMCCTKNWYMYLATDLYALLKHNKVKKIYLFIEDDAIPYITDKRVEFININKIPEYIMQRSPNYKTQYTRMAFVRCYFSKILKEDKIFYIDVDALVVDNLDDLWNMSLDGKLLIGVKEPGEWSKHLGIDGMDDKYINSGVLIMDLKNIRKQRLDDEMIRLLNANFYHYPDQDVINIVFKDKIKYVDNRYNSTETTGMVSNAKIVHYIRERKGWIQTSPRSEIWYNYHKEMLGGTDMVKVEVTERFTLGDYGKLKNIVRKTIDRPGELFVGDVFECDDEMAKYLTGGNALKRPFVKVIEIMPKEEPKVEAKIEYHEEEKKPEVSMKLELEDVKVIAEELNKVTKKTTRGKKSKK